MNIFNIIIKGFDQEMILWTQSPKREQYGQSGDKSPQQHCGE